VYAPYRADARRDPGRCGAVRELAEDVEEPAATTLRDGLDAGRATIALTIEERDQIMRALADCPDRLAELRGVLVRRARVARARGAGLVGAGPRDGLDRHRRLLPLAPEGLSHRDPFDTKPGSN